MKALKKLKLVVISSAIILSSCASQPCPATKVILPPEPTYKSIKAEQLECLDQNTYTDLVINAEVCRSSLRTVRALITEHNKENQ